MHLHNGSTWPVLLALCLAVALSGCGGTPTPTPEPPTQAPTAQAPATETPTPTPTPESQQPTAPTTTSTPTESQQPAASTATPTPTPTVGAVPPAGATTAAPSRCQALDGQLEVQVLVGPADAVGLEPVAVGSVPFAVTTSKPPYLVEGQGPISYEAVLEEDWGTYAVTMDLDTTVQGECSGEAGSEHLSLVLEMTGEQLVVVDAEGFHGEYPWSGAQSRDLVFPLEEGATSQGEGWVVVLHLGSP